MLNEEQKEIKKKSVYPYTYLRLKGKQKPQRFLFIHNPEYFVVLNPSFNYSEYRNDYIAMKNGIYQGYFADMEGNENIKISFEDFEFEPMTSEIIQANKDYIKNIRNLQQAYEDGLNAGDNEEILNMVITEKMKDQASELADVLGEGSKKR